MRSHRIAIILTLAAFHAWAGCGESGQSTPRPSADGPLANEGRLEPKPADDGHDETAALLAAFDPKVLRATELADNIERDPESSDQILARADLDREGLDALMYEIALNPELASQYRIARGLR